jgi:hypothetical protein
MRNNRVVRAFAAILLAVSLAVGLSACSKPESVRDFAWLDGAGKQIQCGDLIAANTSDISTVDMALDKSLRPVVMTAEVPVQSVGRSSSWSQGPMSSQTYPYQLVISRPWDAPPREQQPTRHTCAAEIPSAKHRPLPMSSRSLSI